MEYIALSPSVSHVALALFNALRQSVATKLVSLPSAIVKARDIFNASPDAAGVQGKDGCEAHEGLAVV